MENRTIEQVLEWCAATVRAKDVDGFVALYANDVRVFDLWRRWSYRGGSPARHGRRMVRVAGQRAGGGRVRGLSLPVAQAEATLCGEIAWPSVAA